MGLHAHHPRDCLNYLRDRSVEELQELLAKNDVAYDTKIPEEKKSKLCICLVTIHLTSHHNITIFKPPPPKQIRMII